MPMVVIHMPELEFPGLSIARANVTKSLWEVLGQDLQIKVVKC